MKRILTAAALAPLSMAFWLHAGSALARQRPPSRSFAPQSQPQQRSPSRSFTPQSQPQQDEAPPDSDLPTDDDADSDEASHRFRRKPATCSDRSQAGIPTEASRGGGAV